MKSRELRRVIGRKGGRRGEAVKTEERPREGEERG